MAWYGSAHEAIRFFFAAKILLLELRAQAFSHRSRVERKSSCRMSSVIDLASLIINDDPARVSPLFKLIAKVSDHPKDPLKAAHRTNLLKWLLAQSPQFDSLLEAELSEAEKLDEDGGTDLPDGPPH